MSRRRPILPLMVVMLLAGCGDGGAERQRQLDRFASLCRTFAYIAPADQAAAAATRAAIRRGDLDQNRDLRLADDPQRLAGDSVPSRRLAGMVTISRYPVLVKGEPRFTLNMPILHLDNGLTLSAPPTTDVSCAAAQRREPFDYY